MENKITIVFIHGYISDKNFSYLLTKPLADFVEIKALDLPGHNGVSLGDIKDIFGFINVVNGFIKEDVNGKYIVCGYSFGGVIALEYHNNFFEDPNYLGCLVWASPVNGHLTIASRIMRIIFKFLIPEFVFDFIKSRKAVQKLLLKIGINIKFSKKQELIIILDILEDYKFRLSKIAKKAVFIFHSWDSIISRENLKCIPEGNKVFIVNNLNHLPNKKCIRDVCNIIKNEFILNIGAKEVI
ncbi:hypothetical protein A2W32_04565 [candidate division WWE3 bacterium RBG_16_37_10]|uniref:AB hydrolase-1 domain-containing protein n=1 Tax=candidate division WWE3 bacterium RBG_16_37_10 TaxID=1802610 RepID=A0A1F4V2U9_UNCKA|nr:MAG: hypothetical protein A2W32_04565 [candidate division WWE3 bacterium RBG_16_37_10]